MRQEGCPWYLHGLSHDGRLSGTREALLSSPIKSSPTQAEYCLPKYALHPYSGSLMWPRLEEPPTLSTTKPPVRAVSHSFILSSAVLPPALLMSPCRPSPETPIDVAKQIHDAGMKAGIAISPDTPADVISQEIADSVDMILVMTVHPGQPALPTQTRSSQAHQTLLTPLVYHLAHLSGKGGQKFMEECMPKVRRLRFPDDSPSPLADAEPPHRLSSCSFDSGVRPSQVLPEQEHSSRRRRRSRQHPYMRLCRSKRHRRWFEYLQRQGFQRCHHRYEGGHRRGDQEG
jgi:hypothetical protein